MTNQLTLAQLATFDEIIDVRTPAEFALDHIPGARNYPVLSNLEREQVGTLYKQTSEFEAKRLGAALIARNIAAHLDNGLADRPKRWRPLVYCWRGGMRSGAMQHILQQVGWRADRLAGGYKSYRHEVVAGLAVLPARLRFRVVCGPTGSGKSRLLAALMERGAQVLDLEQLARHRGSVLGGLPHIAQPSQKMFDSLVWWQLLQFDAGRPVFVEAESKKIGNVSLPDALCAAMWQPGNCVRLLVDDALRVALLKQEYAHFLDDPASLLPKFDYLIPLYGHVQIGAWREQALAGQWEDLVYSLLQRHYDRAYGTSMLKHYPDYADSPAVALRALDDAAFRAAAEALLAMPE